MQEDLRHGLAERDLLYFECTKQQHQANAIIYAFNQERRKEDQLDLRISTIDSGRLDYGDLKKARTANNSPKKKRSELLRNYWPSEQGSTQFGKINHG